MWVVYLFFMSIKNNMAKIYENLPEEFTLEQFKRVIIDCTGARYGRTIKEYMCYLCEDGFVNSAGINMFYKVKAAVIE